MIPGQPDFIVYLVLINALVVTRIPIIGKYFNVIDTLFHESGHALVALLTSGKVLKIELFQDTSGTTLTQSKSKISQFLTSLAGYPFSSIGSFVLFYLIKSENYLWVFIIFGVFTLLNLILWVRNWYGIFWLLTFGGLIGLFYYLKNDTYIFCFTLFISAILLFDSIIKCFQLLYLSFKTPKNAGDAANLKKLTHIPAFFWALLFLTNSIFFVYKTVQLFIAI